MGLTLDQKGHVGPVQKAGKALGLPTQPVARGRTGQDRVGKGLASVRSDRGPGHRQGLISTNPTGPLGSRQHRGQPLPALQRHASGFPTSPPTPLCLLHRLLFLLCPPNPSLCSLPSVPLPEWPAPHNPSLHPPDTD